MLLGSRFNEIAGLIPEILLKETPTQVFSCEYCEIFKNIYFEEHLRMANSEKQNNLPNNKALKSVLRKSVSRKNLKETISP